MQGITNTDQSNDGRGLWPELESQVYCAYTRLRAERHGVDFYWLLDRELAVLVDCPIVVFDPQYGRHARGSASR